ncbi:MAG TPA: SAM-dependent methyltransferase, partial [Gammaproteobacteria bacterium]|nr:SAM-dependent methyltransferase [Gammaproteobacteria bacterium]
AAAPFLPEMPPRKPDEPGQFAFADRARVESILRSAGWTGIDVQPLDVVCTLPERDLTPYITRLGPLGRVLQQVGEQQRARIVETVRAAFDPYVQGTQVRFTAACWTVAAHA